MSPIRLVALDIDGTLLTTRKTITPRTRAAIHRVHHRGGRIVLVTGRRYPSAAQVRADLGLRLPLILHNGALVIEDDRVTRCLPLDRGTASKVIAVARRLRADPVVHWGASGEGVLYVEGRIDAHESLARYLGNSRDGVRMVDDLEEILGDDPIQVMFGGSLRDMEALFPQLVRELGPLANTTRTVYPHLGCAFIDVLRGGVSKGEALLWLADRYGVSRGGILAIGDNWNDLEMLHAAGRGLVMGSAEKELLAAGFEILPSSDEDGVAEALERYVLAG